MPYDILEDEAPATPGGYEILGDEPAETPGTLEGIANSFRRGNLAGQRSIEALQFQTETPTIKQGRRAFVGAMEDPRYMEGLMGAEDPAKVESLFGPTARLRAAMGPAKASNVATAQNVADLTKQANAIPSSAAMQEWSKADNSNWWQVFARNPVEITANIFAESIPQAATGMAAGMAAGAAGGPIGAGVGAGVGSFTVEAANAFLEAAANSGVNLEDPEQVRAFFSDEAKVKEAKRFAMTRGFPIALFDGLTAGVAGKFLKPALGKGMARVAGASVAELGTQMAGGALGETAAQVASGQELSAKDIAAEAIGELATAPGEVFSNLRGEARGYEVLPDGDLSQNSEKPKETKPEEKPAAVPVADTSADALAELQAVLRGEAPGSQRLKGALPKVQPEPAGAVSSEPVVVEKRVEVPAALTEEQRAAIEFQRKTDEAVKAAVQNPDKNYEGMSRLELELLEGMGDARATAALRRMRDAEEGQSVAEEGADSFPTLEDISESLKKPEPDQTAVEQGGTKPAAPTLKSGQKQGDLLGSGDVAFNLFAEQTQSGERIEAERQQREDTQREAKAFEEKNQQELPAVDSRIREDLPEAKPILAEIDHIVARAEARHAEMKPGQTKDLTHPNDLLTSEEKGKLHDLKLKLRSKSAQEAKADILKRRAARKAGKDSIESALDAAIEATDFKPRQVNEGVTGAPVWLARAVANGALRIVRAAYRGARSLAQAIRDAVEFLRAQNLPDFNEQEAQAWLESKFQPGVRDELAVLTAQMDAIKARGEEIPAAMLDDYKELVDTLGDEIRSGRANSGAGRVRVDDNLEESGGRSQETGTARRTIPQWKGAERLPGGRLKDLFTGLRAWRVKSGNWLARRGARESIVVNRDVADNRANQAANAASLRVRLILNRAFDTKPGQVRVKHEVREAALTFVVEADGERSRLAEFYDQIGASEHADTKAGRQALAALEYAEANWDKLQPAAAEYKTLTETEREAELNEGVNSPEWKGGYVKHSWARDDVGAGADPTKPAAAGTPFRKPRSVATYAEGIAQGRKPTTLNALELLADRVAGGQRKLNELAWVHGLRNLMDPVTDEPVVVDVIKKPRKPANLPPEGSDRAQAQEDAGETFKPDWVTIAPEGYTVWRFGELEVAVQENFVGLLNKLTAASFFKGSSVKKVFGFIKSSLLMFDTFHLGRMVAWRQMFGLGGGYQKGQTLLDFSTADIREMAARGEIPAGWADGLLENKRRLDLALRTGFNVGNVLDNAWGDALHNLPVVGTFNHWLFGQYQRGAMTEAWLIEFERMSRAIPNAREEQVARRVSKDLNARFGNLNRQGLFKSRTAQDLARFVFLAPQWNESLIRAELGALGQTLKAPMESIQQRRLVVGTLMKATGAMALGTFLANQILNYAFRGKPTWENEEEGWDKKISAYIPDAVSGGPGFFLNPLALPMEYTHLIEGNLHRSGGDLSEALRRVAVSRLHAGMRPLEIFATRKDALGAKLRDGEVLPAMAKALLPIPIGAVAPATAAKQLISGEPSERFPGQYQKQMMASSGVKTDQAPTAEQRIRNLAREFNREKGIVPSAEFFTGDFDELNKALRIGNMTDAREAMDELLKKKTARQIYDHYKRAAAAPFTGQRARESEFWRGLTEEQRSQYLKAREARKATAKKAAEMLKAVAKPAAPI